MRMLLNVKLPHDTFNAAVRDGTVGKKLKRILDELKPEAVYFTEHEGHRGATLVINLEDLQRFRPLPNPGFFCSTPTASFASP